jgi:N-acyl amino acid synthase of PEP-CTERM/exosortase system
MGAILGSGSFFIIFNSSNTLSIKIMNIKDSFNEYFEMVPAISKKLLNEVYKLRYQVYCIETGFENPELYLDGLESDEFDRQSFHYLIRHRKTYAYAATTRLIIPKADDILNQFPIEKHCVINRADLIKDIPRNTLAEASRFCVSKLFKRRKNELGTLTGIDTESVNTFTDMERRTFPHITIALFACLIKMSYENHISHWYAVMEPGLIRYFTTLGIHFVPIGPLADYHGKRQPCIIKVSDLLEGVAEKDKNTWDMMTNSGQVILS